MSKCEECGNTYKEGEVICVVCDEVVVDEVRPKLVAVSAITAQLKAKNLKSELSSEIGNLWPVNNDICYSFITQVERRFKNKNKFHSYYEEQDEEDSVPSLFKKLISSELAFKSLVKLLMDELVEAAEEAGAHKVAGANIVFMHYKSSAKVKDTGRLLVVMVDNKSGFKFDDKLIPEEEKHVNISALKQAALFDLALFDEIYPDPPNRDTYLKFIQGSSTGAFFKNAFGCEIKADNGRSVDELYRALFDYHSKNELSNDFYEDARSKITEAFKNAAKSITKKQVSLRELAVIVESSLPKGSELSGTFLNFVNRNYSVNEIIEPTKQSAGAADWVDIKARDESFKAKIYRSQIGADGSGKTVEYNIDTHRLSLDVEDAVTRDALERLVAGQTDE